MDSEAIRVRFGIDQDQVREAFTSDISSAECIFDLIDNSIDAARETYFEKKKAKVDKNGLPASYSGYAINVHVSPGFLAIQDNCHGMSAEVLGEEAFWSGKRTEHPFGIGYFGLGLVRSILKLATNVALHTDTGSQAYRCKFGDAEINNNEANPIFAYPNRTKGRPSNLLAISGFSPEISYDFRSSEWKSQLVETITQRYGVFVKKGLKIFVNGKPIEEFGPGLRDHPHFAVVEENRTLGNGVKVFLRVGTHSDWIFKDEPNFTKSRNKKLKQVSGWYAVCNDRIIRIADQGNQTEWFTSWHGEYNGFVGWVHFVSKTPSLLPWDSKKANLNRNSTAYQETVDWLREVGDRYRTANRRLLKETKDGQSPGGSGSSGKSSSSGAATSSSTSTVSTSSPPSTAPSRRERLGGAPETSTEAVPHHKDHPYLMWPCQFSTDNRKVLALVHEAQTIPIRDFPYSSALLLRSLLEAVLEDYLKRTDHWEKVCDEVVQKRSANREKQGKGPLPPDLAANVNPGLDDKLSYIKRHTEALPRENRRLLKSNIDSLRSDIGELNGITHEDGVFTNRERISAFRERIVPIVEVLLAAASAKTG